MNKLESLYKQINQLNDEIPSQLSKKIFLYSQVLQYVGKYHSEAILDHGKAYADRKGTWGKTMHDTPGTGIVKEGAAEIAIHFLRIKEAEAESEVWRWRNSFTATQEIINSLKIQLKTLMAELDNTKYE